MFYRVSCRVSVENGTEVTLEEGRESSSEKQVETPKRELSEMGLTDPVIDPAEPPKKWGALGCHKTQATHEKLT